MREPPLIIRFKIASHVAVGSNASVWALPPDVG